MRAEAAIATIRARREIRLSVDRTHAGLKLSQVSPAAPVQGQFADCRCIYHRTNVRARQLHGGYFAFHYYLFGKGADPERKVQDYRCSNGQRNSSPHLGLKSARRERYDIGSRQQIGRRVETFLIGGDFAFHASCDVFNRNLNIGNDSATAVGDCACHRTSSHLCIYGYGVNVEENSEGYDDHAQRSEIRIASHGRAPFCSARRRA